MKNLLISLFLICCATTLFAQKQFVVDANAEIRTIEGSFNEIKVSGGIDLYLSQSDNEAVAVSTTDEKYRANIKTVVENNVLKVYYEAEKWWGNNNKKMTVYVSFINLEKLDASGASDIKVAGTIKAAALKMILSGASDFKGAVEVTSLEMNLSGASDVNISGTANNLNIESSGASDVDGYGLTTDICSAKASGASDIHVTVNKELNAHASGASNIYYHGTGVIKEIQSNGASSVKKKGS
jgi:hypothetical protein